MFASSRILAAALLLAALAVDSFGPRARPHVGLPRGSPRTACATMRARTATTRPEGGRRSQRVGQVVRGELATLISGGSIHMQRNTLKEEVRQMISIVDVTVTDDMRTAKVRVSTLGEKLDGLRAIRWLQDNRKSIRFELAQRLTYMRRIPELMFVDVDISSPVRVMALIDKLAAESRELGEANRADATAGDGEGDGELDGEADDDGEFDFEVADEEDDALDFDWAEKK